MAEEINEQQILDYATAGMKPAQIAERIGGGLTPQKVGMIIKANAPDEGNDDEDEDEKPKKKGKSTVVKADALGEGPQVMKAQEYMDYSRKAGRTAFGGEIGVKRDCSIEELRAYINSKWKPSMIIEKYQIDEKEFQSLVFNLSKRELREAPIKYNLKQDLFY